MAEKDRTAFQGRHVVEVTMGHLSSRGDRDGIFRLQVADVGTGRLLAEVELTSIAVAKMLVGASSQAATLTFLNRYPVGMHNWKDEVWVPGERSDDKDMALAPFNVDGWSCRASDFGNHHCRVQVDGVWGYRVTRSALRDTPQPGRMNREYDPRVSIIESARDIIANLIRDMGETP